MSPSRKAANGADRTTAPGSRASLRLAVALLAGLTSAAWACRATTSGGSGPAEAAGRTTPAQFVERYCLDCHDEGVQEGRPQPRVRRPHGVGDRPRAARAGRPQAPAPADAAARRGAAGRGHLRCGDRPAGGGARPRGPGAARIPAAPMRSGGSPAPNIRTRSATCSGSTSTRPRCCPTTSRATGSTTSPSAICRPRCSNATSRRRRRSPASPSARPARPRPARRFACPPTSRRRSTSRGCPLGTRGGAQFPYVFPQDGQYEIQVRLARDRNEQVEGLKKPHEIEVLIDRERVGLFTVQPPGADKNYEAVDAHLKVRVAARAGPHLVAATFPKRPVVAARDRAPAVHRALQHAPASAHGARPVPALDHRPLRRHRPRRHAQPPPASSAARAPRRRPPRAAEQEARARQILAPLVRRAYRRPVTERGSAQAAAVLPRGQRRRGRLRRRDRERARRILVSPRFLIRTEEDPPGPRRRRRPPRQRPRARLAAVVLSLEQHPRRRADRGRRARRPAPAGPAASDRSAACSPTGARDSLVTNFASQWLQLRKLDSITPDARLFPNFDDNLRQSLRRETELFFESVLREDRSVTDLVRADYSFLNERLAQHYGIPHVQGSRFRRVSFAGDPGAPARRPPATGEHPDHHVVRHAHVAGDPRPLHPGEPRRRAAAAPAPRRPRPGGEHRVGHAAHARAPGRPPHQPLLRALPQAHGSGRVLAGELRRRRPLAGRRGSPTDRRLGRAARRQHVRRGGRARARRCASGPSCWPRRSPRSC